MNGKIGNWLLFRQVVVMIILVMAGIAHGQTQMTGIGQIRQRVCHSYLEVQNRVPELRMRADEIVKQGDNPDIMIRELREGIDPEQINLYLKTLGADGSWPDLDYADRSRSGWQPSVHAARLLELAKVYHTDLYHQPEVSRKIHAALRYWFQGNFRCTNWWYNEIGVPKMMGGVFLLMREELEPDEMEAAVKYMENARLGRTGQNKVWLAENVLLRALLQNDTVLLLRAAREMKDELRINQEGEGIRPDCSFHQHGAQLQFGNYGLAFANTLAYWAHMFQGTSYAWEEKRLKVLRDYLLEGMRWVVWKGYMDVSSCGRQLFRSAQEGKALSLGKALQHMKVADPAYARQYEYFYGKHIRKDGTGNEPAGFRFFPYSDFGVYRGRDWCATLKMSSGRVIGSEIVNSENLRGDYAGSGVLLVYRKGNEYEDIFPVWDWQRLPGVTCREDKLLFRQQREWEMFRNEADFVGGISDGEQGMMAMQLKQNGIEGCKTYFFTEDAIVCVGSGLRSNEPGRLVTGFAQCLMQGEAEQALIVAASGERQKAYYHDGTVYVFPEKEEIEGGGEWQRGNWRRVAAFYDTSDVEKKVFGLWKSHRKDPAYVCAIFPDVTPSGWREKVAGFSWSQVINEPDIHAFREKNSWQMVFYKPGKLKMESGKLLTVNEACMLTVKRYGKRYTLRISDPTWKQQEIEVKIQGRWSGENAVYDASRNETVWKVNVEHKQGGYEELNVIGGK